MGSSSARKQRRMEARGKAPLQALAGLAGAGLGGLQKQMQDFVKATSEVQQAAKDFEMIQAFGTQLEQLTQVAIQLEREQERQRWVNLRLQLELSHGAVLWSQSREDNFARLKALEEKLRAEFDATVQPDAQPDETQ